jgi:hypothetical protein
MEFRKWLLLLRLRRLFFFFLRCLSRRARSRFSATGPARYGEKAGFKAGNVA